MKLIDECSNEKLFLSNHKMLATDFQIMDRKFLWDIEKKNDSANLLVCNMPYFFLNFAFSLMT